jgi:hypothetical protein
VVHRRTVFSLKSQFCLVRDVAEGDGKHRLDLFWHMAPELRSQGKRSEGFIDDRGGRGILALTAEGHGWSQDVRQGTWSPVYGRAERSSILHFGTMADLPAEFVTLLIPVAQTNLPAGEFTRIAEGSSQRTVWSYRYRTLTREHWVFFAAGKQEWTAGPWTSDAEFVYWGADRQGNDRALIFCNGSYVAMGGRRVVACRRKVERYEATSSGSQMKVFSSDEDAVVAREPIAGISADREPVGAGRKGN